METRTFGRTGKSVPVIGQGTWRMERDDRDACIEALRAGIDAGATHIDTAEMYGSGEVEECVAEAIEGRRDELFLVSKVLPHHATFQGTLSACEGSLRRLGTDYLDVYLLHWPGEHPLEQTIKAFEQLERDGKIRAWGVSNFGLPELKEALAIAGEGRIACNQVLYHLGERAIEHEVQPWCEAHGIPVVGYSPLGAGDFPSPKSKGGKVLAEIAERRKVSPQQLALRFLVRNPTVFTIPKAARAAHAVDCARAGDLQLSPEELKQIDQAFPRGTRRGLPML